MSFEKSWLRTDFPETRIARHVLRPEVLNHLNSVSRLDWQGIHGVANWTRVVRYAPRIATREDGDPLVAALFAVLHDHQRWNEGRDRDHGARAADAMDAIGDRGWFSDWNAGQLALIEEATRHHSDGWMHSDPSIGACWDADRLDLVRLGIAPSHGLLCTSTAKKMASVHTVSPSSALKHRLTVVSGGWREPVES